MDWYPPALPHTAQPTPFREEQGRLGIRTFYHAQEDEVFAAAARRGFTGYLPSDGALSALFERPRADPLIP